MVLADQTDRRCLWADMTWLSAAQHAWLSSRCKAAMEQVRVSPAQACRDFDHSCELGSVSMMLMMLSCHWAATSAAVLGGTWHSQVQIPWRPG